MANNADLTKDILALAPETVVEGKTNKQLVEILKGLRANATPPTPDEAEQKKADDEAEQKKADDEPVKLAPYTIAKGKSITCAKGSLKEGDEVKLEYLNDDKEALKRLIKKGFVVKN